MNGLRGMVSTNGKMVRSTVANCSKPGCMGKVFLNGEMADLYEGAYENDLKHWYGVFSWPYGRKYDGYWVNG